MKKKVLVLLLIVTVMLAACSKHQQFNGDIDVFANFNKIAKNINLEITSVSRYNLDYIYYYDFHFKYYNQTKEDYEQSELIYVYNSSTKVLYFFNINDSEYYVNDYNKYTKAKENGDAKIFNETEIVDLMEN